MKHLLLSLVLILFSCKTDKADASLEESIAKPATELSDDQVNELYKYYTADPKIQDHKDQNALIDFAISKSIFPQRTTSGLYYVIREQGSGPTYLHGQPCKVHYSGYFLDGKIFDSSYKKNRPITFNVGQMIPGWNEALKLMNTGTKATLLVPSRLAYADRGFPGYVPPNTPIIFDIHILPIVG